MPLNLDSCFRPWSRLIEDEFTEFGIFLLEAEQKQLKGRPWLIKNLAFFLLCLLSTLVITSIISSKLMNLGQDLNLYIVKIYLSTLVLMWISASLTLPRWSLKLLGVWFVTVVFFVAPVAILILQTLSGINPRFSFWVVLLMWTTFAVAGVWKIKKGWPKFILIAGTVWTVFSAISTLGMSNFLPYSQKALGEISGYHRLLDVRLISTIVFASGLISTSFMFAWKRGLPDIAPLPFRAIPQPKENDSQWVRYLLGPFLTIAKVAHELVYSLANIFWQAFAILVIFFTRVGEELAKLINSFGSERRSWSWIATCLASFFTLVVIFSMVSNSSDLLTYYLLDTHGLGSGIKTFLWLSINTFFCLVLIIFLSWLIQENRENSLSGPLQALMFLLAIVFVAGVLMLGVSRIDSLNIKGFQKPGPFVVTLLTLVVSGIIFWMYHQRFGNNKEEHGASKG